MNYYTESSVSSFPEEFRCEAAPLLVRLLRFL